MRTDYRAPVFTRSELVAIKLGLMDRIESMHGESDERLAPFKLAMGKAMARIRIIDTKATGKAIKGLVDAVNK